MEALRLANIAKNKALLEALELTQDVTVALGLPPSPVKSAPKPKAKAPPKPRKSASSASVSSSSKRTRDEDGDESSGPASKASRVSTLSEGVRRSGRNTGRVVTYNEEKVVVSTPTPLSAPKRTVRIVGDDGEEMDAEMEGAAADVGNKLGTRKYSPKTYGAIPGIAVGTWWATRAQCSTDAIHAPFVAGIASGPQGAFSVALSGGYEDDVDLGYALTYTGSGGRDLKGTPQNRKNLRTAPQSCDQSWDNSFNKAMKKSAETKKPVRVIRGYKLDSEWAPAEGYRYDGLYRVEKAWMERGLNKGRFKVCKFALKRIDGQAPLARTERPAAVSDDEDIEEEDEEEAEDEESTAGAEPGQTGTDAEDDVPASEAATDSEEVAGEIADTAADTLADAAEISEVPAAVPADVPIVAAAA